MTKNQFIIFVIVSAIVMGIASQVGAHMVDQATAKQCLTHDWPAHLDTIHRDWCVDNGYKIN